MDLTGEAEFETGLQSSLSCSRFSLSFHPVSSHLLLSTPLPLSLSLLHLFSLTLSATTLSEPAKSLCGSYKRDIVAVPRGDWRRSRSCVFSLSFGYYKTVMVDKSWYALVFISTDFFCFCKKINYSGKVLVWQMIHLFIKQLINKRSLSVEKNGPPVKTWQILLHASLSSWFI